MTTTSIAGAETPEQERGSRMVIIGLSGPKGSGKSTAAGMLASMTGFERMSFADPLRAAALALFTDLTPEHFEPGRKEEPVSVPYFMASPRDVLQALGDAARAIDGPVLIVAMLERLGQLAAAGVAGLVIDDVRMQAEADVVRLWGGRVVHVERPGVEWSDSHATEAGPGRAEGDLVLVNRSRDELQVACGRLLDSIGVGHSAASDKVLPSRDA